MTDVVFQTHVGNYAPPDMALMRGLGMMGLTDTGVPQLREREGRVTATKGTGRPPGGAWEPTRGISSTEGRALCASVDPEMWFPDTGQSDKAKEAKALCRMCPIREKCSAQSAGESFGIWGGESVNDRTRRRAKKVAPPEMEVAHTVPAPELVKPKAKKRKRPKKRRHLYVVKDVPLPDHLPGRLCLPNADCTGCWPDD